MTTFSRESVIKPGMFGLAVAADNRRGEFDFGNESLLMEGVCPDALFIGDSITHLWELQAYFGHSGKLLINRGIGGDISTFVRKRFAADALQLQPKLIVMKIGTNDLGWEIGQLNEATSDTICENITAMTAETKAAGIQMAICSILPIWGPSWQMCAEFTVRKNEQIVQLNRRLQVIAVENDAIYVDYFSSMVNAAGELQHDLADDGVHPHGKGYAIMAQVLRTELAKHSITI